MRPADTFHKPGFKMHVKILHHLFGVVGSDVIKAPLWDVAALGPAAYPSNAVFVHHHVTQLLTTSFPNMRAPQVEVRLAPRSLSLVAICTVQQVCVHTHDSPGFSGLGLVSGVLCSEPAIQMAGVR